MCRRFGVPTRTDLYIKLNEKYQINLKNIVLKWLDFMSRYILIYTDINY
jgi:hypothetical protein